MDTARFPETSACTSQSTRHLNPKERLQKRENITRGRNVIILCFPEQLLE